MGFSVSGNFDNQGDFQYSENGDIVKQIEKQNDDKEITEIKNLLLKYQEQINNNSEQIKKVTSNGNTIIEKLEVLMNNEDSIEFKDIAKKLFNKFGEKSIDIISDIIKKFL